MEALRECDFDTARVIIRAGALPLPFPDLLDEGETIFPVGAGGVHVGFPGNNSRVLDRVVRGDAGMVRIFHAYGVDLNAPRHRFGPSQISLLMMAIDYAPETVARAAPEQRAMSGKAQVVRALIECGAELDYCTDRSTALISAILQDDVHATVLLLHAGASTSARPSVIQRDDWALADVTYSSGSRCSPELLRALVCYQLTGLTRHASECFADPRRVREPAHRSQHCPEMLIAGELGTWMGGIWAAKSGRALREQGNEEMRQKQWANALISYSAALIQGSFVGEDVEADPEPHKILANRSLAHLRLAQEQARQEAQARSETEAHALMAAPARKKVALPPLPDLMEALGVEAVLSGASAEPTGEQAARGLRPSMASRALAFADATRAAATAPSPWAKAHARVAEAAYEIAVQCWARGDRHGVHCMRQICSNEYRLAAEAEPSGGFITCAMRVDKELLVTPPRRASEADDDDDSDDEGSPLARLKQHVRLLTHAGVTESDLAAAGFAMPPAAELAGMTETEVSALQAQLDTACESRPDFDEKVGLANRRRMQGSTDIPATREVAGAAPYGAANELWTMSFSTIGYTRGQVPMWAISIVDATPAPHPYADLLVGSGVHHGSDRPTLEECEDTLLRAVQYPCHAAGPSRRPRRLVLAWRMREMYEALEALAGGMGISVTLEAYEVALAIAEAHGKSIEGRNHGPAE